MWIFIEEIAFFLMFGVFAGIPCLIGTGIIYFILGKIKKKPWRKPFLQIMGITFLTLGLGIFITNFGCY